jgi:hypothetical protein
VIKSHVLYRLSYALAPRAKTVETVEPDFANPAMPTPLASVRFIGPRTGVVPRPWAAFAAHEYVGIRARAV